MEYIGFDTDAVYVDMSKVSLSDIFDYYAFSVKDNKNDISRDYILNKNILNDMYGLCNK